MNDTYWNGEPADCTRGTGVVLDSPRFPRFWAREAGLIGKRVPVVRVEYGGKVTFIYNLHGQGWAKVTEGRGSPRIAHASLDVGKFVPDEVER
jgi:hypothetical protein